VGARRAASDHAVSLDGPDNDPVTLISAVATSFRQARGLDRAFWDSMSSPGGAVLGRLRPRLAGALEPVGIPAGTFTTGTDDPRAGDRSGRCLRARVSPLR
jgi:hypothetical protein